MDSLDCDLGETLPADRNGGPAVSPDPSLYIRGGGPTEGYKAKVKLSVSVPVSLGERLRVLNFKHRISVSAIVQIALEQFFVQGDDLYLGSVLRDSGASLRCKIASPEN